MVELGFEAPVANASPWQRVRRVLERENVDTIDRLLAIVQRDLDTTNPEIGQLAPILQRSGSAVIGLPNGWYSSHLGNEWPCTSPHPDATLAAMADSVQDCLVEVLQMQWPICPVHDGMLRISGDDHVPVWVCDREGHSVARVGELSR